MSDTSVDEDGDNEQPRAPAIPHVDGQPVSYAANSGSVRPEDAVKDAHATTHEHVGMSHTTFDPTEAVNTEKFHRLQQRERGLYDAAENRRGQQIRGHRQRDIDHMGSVLEASEATVEYAKQLVASADLEENFGPYPHEVVSLAALTIACNQNDQDPRPENPFPDGGMGDAYVELREVNDVSANIVKKCRDKLRDTELRDNPESIYNRSLLKELYVDEELSTTEIANRLGVSHVTILRRLRLYDIPVRDRGHGLDEMDDSKRVPNPSGPLQTMNGYSLFFDDDEYIRIHRLVAVAEFGIDAVIDNNVHHIDGCKWNNGRDNLAVLSNAEHGLIHKDDAVSVTDDRQGVCSSL